MKLLRGWFVLCLTCVTLGCEEAAQAPAPPTTVPTAGPTTSPADPAHTSPAPDSGPTATGGVIDAPPAPPPPPQ